MYGLAMLSCRCVGFPVICRLFAVFTTNGGMRAGAKLPPFKPTHFCKEFNMSAYVRKHTICKT